MYIGNDGNLKLNNYLLFYIIYDIIYYICWYVSVFKVIDINKGRLICCFDSFFVRLEICVGFNNLLIYRIIIYFWILL